MRSGAFGRRPAQLCVCVLLAVGLLSFCMAPTARAGERSVAAAWLERESPVFGLTNGELVMIGGAVVIVGGTVLVLEPALAGGILGGLVVLEGGFLAAKLAAGAGVAGALALGYDLEEDLGIPPFWRRLPGFRGREDGPLEAAAAEGE